MSNRLKPEKRSGLIIKLGAHVHDCYIWVAGLFTIGMDGIEADLKEHTKAIQEHPNHANAYYCLGNTYFNIKSYEKAIDAYKQAIELNPDDFLSYYSLGIAYDCIGRYKEQVLAFKEAVRIDPSDAYAHICLGDAYYELERFNEAIGAYTKAIDLEPDNVDAHMNLAKAYLKMGNWDLALEHYEILKILGEESTNDLNSLITEVSCHTQTHTEQKNAEHEEPTSKFSIKRIVRYLRPSPG